ncbi:glycosyltransferase family 2 protein [Vibrio cholerae]|uniref:glycosyltransferase family 2 protein n=1 Tax=Vibrio cholerae TaxID=666 RepID=UPI000B48DAA1|nr:glycosyltransferase family 2 protein [Vibrio cholerae]EGQ9613085.1 glycosyl transferase family 2 [Vibrio cholerae]EGR4458247.1 glycosyl transferase family 2 [Vibrio cholerae]EGR5448081.1 glycosyl transferase family 2 [Vibrio cholerae]EGR5456078.1 glycosyl transferase family 2 [Vibrio cholerae]EGR5464269.1 glycosyl transferase family 2 [Vibrio cholerae]
MINIVIPMAGAGSRFAKAGYVDPKPLIKIDGYAMIELVINNLKPKEEHRFIFICQKKHVDQYDLRNKLTGWAPNCEVIEIDSLTEGAACTVLCAKQFINDDNPLMIANSDQYVDIDINDYLDFMKNNSLDGLIMTMDANDPKWSYVGFDDEGKVNRVVEKEAISNEATVGIYNFKKGSDFIKSAENMIKQELRVNGEYYVAPVYNQLIQKNWKVGVFSIGSEANGMYGLGIPSDLDLFKSLPICKKAIEAIR